MVAPSLSTPAGRVAGAVAEATAAGHHSLLFDLSPFDILAVELGVPAGPSVCVTEAILGDPAPA